MAPKTCDVPRYEDVGSGLRGMSFAEALLVGGLIGFVIAMILLGGIVLFMA